MSPRPLRIYLLVIALGVLLAMPAAALEIMVGLPYGKHTIGHTAVRVRTFDQNGEVIYDFGRYGRTWGHLHFHGEGIMRVWRGPREIKRYLQKQQSFRDTVGFTIDVPEQEERQIYRYYENLLANKRWRRPNDMHVRYRLAEDYNGINNQCTSMALAGMKAVLPRPNWEKLLHPRFNKGQGFNAVTKDYFFKTQRKLGIDETVVPLDVLDALTDSRKQANPLAGKVRRYPRLRGHRQARPPAGGAPPVPR